MASAAVVVAVAGACGSSHPRQAAVDNPSTPTSATPAPATSAPATTAPATTVAGQLTTVPNCGGGAYKPATLLIVCGNGNEATMATGVSWTSWNAASAAGTGSVHLVAAGKPVVAPGRLTLGTVKQGSMGPQFTRLTVTWTGTSPDGHPSDVYPLQIEP